MVFLFGDLNFRIDSTNEFVRPAIKKGDFKFLKSHDELLSSFELYRHSKEMPH